MTGGFIISQRQTPKFAFHPIMLTNQIEFCCALFNFSFFISHLQLHYVEESVHYQEEYIGEYRMEFCVKPNGVYEC